MDYFDLGRRVKDLRRQQNMTQEELAEKIDVSASFLGHIERGTRIASLETLVKLCQALDTDPNYLLAASTSSISFFVVWHVVCGFDAFFGLSVNVGTH